MEDRVVIVSQYGKGYMNKQKVKNLLIRMFPESTISEMNSVCDELLPTDIINYIAELQSYNIEVKNIIVDTIYKDFPCKFIKETNLNKSIKFKKIKYWYLEPKVTGVWEGRPALLSYIGEDGKDIDLKNLNI